MYVLAYVSQHMPLKKHYTLPIAPVHDKLTILRPTYSRKFVCAPHWLPLQHKYSPKMGPVIDKGRAEKTV